jgi:class 3 adenylate cyclase/tetratricopeptide (TPR) repeat protein
VVVCSSCGATNREGARFCDSCGAPLAEAAPVREVRKTVTVFFCDVSGSTALGEQIDPESLRHVMARYFETTKTILERHGGTVEKFIGDAVMAVFGVPTVHEDDALRALRAAEELRDGLAGLNDELEQAYGTRLELRIGVNTGEVVTGTEERIATGDAVNVAARLEQAAPPGEVLVGEETFRLVRDAVEVEPVEPVAAKGKAEPVRAYRLVAVKSETAPRRAGAPMVGRERQRKLLEDAFANAVAERSCQLFTVLGPAGVGKSRLVAEFLGSLDDATVARSRCLSYGEGVGYWPVTEVVLQLLGDGDPGALGAILGDESAAGSPDEIAWAFRKLLEARASERPLVVVFDDVHWGEPTFLDLVEHVADLSRDAPILLLCVARPELLDHRPTWGGGKLNATNILLEPLAPYESRELIEALVRDQQIDAGLRDRILESAAGNPLFVEEMVAMVGEGGDADVSVPPTIHALLAARLDQLDTAERGVLERGAVEGQVFHRGAVVALAPEDTRVDGRLVALVRKDLVRPDQPLVANDEAYRFRHLLIRDTAYEALPKAVRAELHERFAAWLASHADELIESDELVGYHLGQSYRYRVELGPLDEAAHALAERAARRLLISAERARTRGDSQAAEGLLSQAVELLPADDPTRAAAQVELAVVMTERGGFAAAGPLRAEAAAAARAAGDERLLARLQLAELEAQTLHDPTMTLRGALATAEQALSELERVGDEEGAAWALRMMGNYKAWLGSSAEAEQLWTRSYERAQNVSPRLANEARIWMMWTAWWGPTPVDEGIRRCEEFLHSPSKRVEATALLIGGQLKAPQGRFDEARADLAAGRSLFRELGDEIWWAGASMLLADTELLAGAHERAYEILTEGHTALAGASETGYLATVVGMRAQAALELGRLDEALALAEETARVSAADDFEPHARRRLVVARALARRGDLAAADELLREAAEIVEPTDYVILHLDLAFAQADVARVAGRQDEERRALERALEVAEAKGNVVAAKRARERVAEASHRLRYRFDEDGDGIGRGG